MIQDNLSQVYGRAFKGDVPPDWWRNSRQLSALLRGRWNEVSADFLSEMKAALSSQDFDKMTELLGSLEGLGVRMSDAIGDRLEAVFESVQNKAISAYSIHGKHDLALKRIKTFSGEYKQFLNELHAEQVRNFAQANPMRILHPEIERQIGYMRDMDWGRSIDVDLLGRRLDRMVGQEAYWDGLSDIQVARIWHRNHLAGSEMNAAG